MFQKPAALGPRRLTNAFSVGDNGLYTAPSPTTSSSSSSNTPVRKHRFTPVKIHVMASKPRSLSRVQSELTLKTDSETATDRETQAYAERTVCKDDSMLSPISRKSRFTNRLMSASAPTTPMGSPPRRASRSTRKRHVHVGVLSPLSPGAGGPVFGEGEGEGGGKGRGRGKGKSRSLSPAPDGGGSGSSKASQAAKQAAKIPSINKAAFPNALVKDRHDYTGYIPQGTMSVNMEIAYGVTTRAGNTTKNARKFNQDTFICEDVLFGNPHLHLFGVFDGHGVFGHLVSHAVRDYIGNYFGDDKNIPILNNTASAGMGGAAPVNYGNALSKSIAYASKQLKAAGGSINSSFSGCTGTLCIVDSKARYIYTANVGDSRIVLGRGKKSVADIVQLTTDHDPCLKAERDRIVKAGGESN